MKNVGLIIQGPILSVGKDGKNAHVRKIDMDNDKDYVHFDCRDNIQRIVNNYGVLFKKIVVSTWEGELKPEDNWSGVYVVASPDPGEVRRDKFIPRSRNKYRQFIGILSGIKELEKDSDIEYVVRIRTDQYVDLKRLVESFLELTKSDSYESDLIGVPFTRPQDFFVHDLYFASKIGTLKKFCQALLSFDQHEFISCVHREMILKHAYFNYRNSINVEDPAYFPYWPACGSSSSTKKIFTYMFQKVFYPLDQDIFRSVEWRGSKLSDEQIIAQYPDKNERRKNMINIPMFVSTNWGIYFNFLELCNHKKVSFMDKVKLITGKFLWNLWNDLRDLSAYLKLTPLVYKLVNVVKS